MAIMIHLSRAEKRQPRIWIQREPDAGTRTRMSILLHLARGRPARQVADSLRLARSTVYRVAERFGAEGFAGLADRREDNGPPGVDESFLLSLRQVVAGSPQDYGWPRPTWTQELLCVVLARQTGRLVSQPTMSRCLKAIGARLGRPWPVVGCPWPKARRNRHARRIRRLIAQLPTDEVALYADEVDIHLNPRIGSDSREVCRIAKCAWSDHRAGNPPQRRRRAGPRADRRPDATARRSRRVFLLLPRWLGRRPGSPGVRPLRDPRAAELRQPLVPRAASPAELDGRPGDELLAGGTISVTFPAGRWAGPLVSGRLRLGSLPSGQGRSEGPSANASVGHQWRQGS